ncbi:gluconate 2-dehydrogenase subunit 3 family protein [Bordetella sp. N]|uniref:gluconate 2-dehydrogenase subunit 3 family protein n=1 Tax=Bordetella sp. N TaxID=1746199 RepID=UPI00070A986A|nr:gluconate 2-dehydrogenase subunit 3 family protein [Bordetella sp. N]ALM82950.1 gluconate 2-dehydrogenase [Bordetella sp. N]
MSNDDQEPRRKFLRQVISIVPASTLATGAALTQTACSSGTSTTTAASTNTSYDPRYFTADEWKFLHAAVDRLIPADELGPGAVAAQVPVFLDKQMELPYGHGKLWYMQGPFHTDQTPEMGYQLSLAPRDIYRLGIAACDAYCKKQFNKIFADLDHAQQEAVLGDMEHNKVKFDQVPANTFFGYLLKNTKEGFLSDPIHGGNVDMVGWKLMGFPGARADFADWADRPGEKYPYGPVSISGRRG